MLQFVFIRNEKFVDNNCETNNRNKNNMNYLLFRLSPT